MPTKTRLQSSKDRGGFLYRGKHRPATFGNPEYTPRHSVGRPAPVHSRVTQRGINSFKVAVAAVASVILLVAPVQAPAASSGFRVTSTVSPVVTDGATQRVVVRAKLTRSGTVRTTFYKGSTPVRVLKTTRRAKSHTINWNLRDSNGDQVKPGSYWYRTNAVAGSSKAWTAKRFAVVAAPATAPVSQAPSTGGEAAPAPVAPAPTAPAPAPAPAPSPTPATSGRWVGVYQSGAPADMSKLDGFETKIGAKAKVVHFYVADSGGFPTSHVRNIGSRGSIPLVSLEFWSLENGGLTALLNGSKDAYLRNFADQAKAYGGEVWLRPFHEMNGNWYPWCGSVNGNNSTELIAAWRHVKGIFAERGATNVKFVWSPNNDSVPNTSANQIEKYWPGSSYVDYVALDGYNFGTSQSWSSWRSFTNTFGSAYNKVKALTTRPMFIAETASAEQGGNKASWIASMFGTIPSSYPRIQGVVWFNTNKETDWRVESSSASLTAFKAGIKAGY